MPGSLADAHGLVPTGGSDYHGIHDDEREPGDITFAETDVARFLATLEEAWASRRTDATDAMAGA